MFRHFRMIWSTTALQSQQTTRLPVGCRWLTTIITIFSIPHIPKDRVPWFIKSCPNRCQSGEFAGGDATRIGLQDRAAMRRHGVTIGRPWRLPRKLVTWWQHFNVEPQSFWKMRWYCLFIHQYHSWYIYIYIYIHIYIHIYTYIYIYLGTQTSIIVQSYAVFIVIAYCFNSIMTIYIHVIHAIDKMYRWWFGILCVLHSSRRDDPKWRIMFSWFQRWILDNVVRLCFGFHQTAYNVHINQNWHHCFCKVWTCLSPALKKAFLVSPFDGIPKTIKDLQITTPSNICRPCKIGQ